MDGLERADPETPIQRLPESRLTTIYEAAASVFVREGYAGATSRALSAASGVAESTLFRLIHDKSSLYRSLFDYAWSEVNALVAGAGFVPDVDIPARNTDPAEVLIGDLGVLARSFEDVRLRPLVTFAFEVLGRPAPGFEPLASAPYARFRERLTSYATLDMQRRDRGRHADARALADALLARVRSAWMGWFHTSDAIAERRPTFEELTEHLRREFEPDVGVDEQRPLAVRPLADAS